MIDGKGVVILNEGAVAIGTAQTFANFLTIRKALPQHLVTVRCLQMGGGFGQEVTNCLGPVTYDGLGGALGGSGPRGCQLVWQAADLTAAGVVELSNPSPSYVS